MPASCCKRVVCQSSAHSLLGSIRGQCHPQYLQDWSAQACRIDVMHTHCILAAIIRHEQTSTRPANSSGAWILWSKLHADPYCAARRSTPTSCNLWTWGFASKESSSSLLARGNGHMPGRGMRLWLESDDEQALILIGRHISHRSPRDILE